MCVGSLVAEAGRFVRVGSLVVVVLNGRVGQIYVCLGSLVVVVLNGRGGQICSASRRTNEKVSALTRFQLGVQLACGPWLAQAGRVWKQTTVTTLCDQC